MPVDPSGVTTDDHGQGGGGAQQQPEKPTIGNGPAADARAGLPPVAGTGTPSGDSNGHDEAGLPPTGGAGMTDRLGGDTRGSDPGVADTDARAQEWRRGADPGVEGGAQRFGEVPPGQPQSLWSTFTPVAPSPAGPATEGASEGGPAGAATVPAPAVDPDFDADGTEHFGDGAHEPVNPRRLARRVRPRRAHKPKARRGLRVRQRLWSIDPWSVFKLSVLFYVCVCLIVVVAGTLLWNVGRSAGTIDDVESFITRMGAYGTCTLKAEVPAGTEFEEDDDCAEGEVLVGGFKVDDGTLFRVAAIGGGILVVAGSIGNVLMVVLLNLLNELTGGLRYTIVKEPIPRPAAARQRAVRAPGQRAAGGPGGPRHAAKQRSPALPAAVDGDGGDREQSVRVPAVEGSTDRDTQG
jgi:Transmembrane domain of unknown function (DUF3566)